MFSVLGGITLLAYVYSLNNIKSKTVGDGQHGTADGSGSGSGDIGHGRRTPANVKQDLTRDAVALP